VNPNKALHSRRVITVVAFGFLVILAARWPLLPPLRAADNPKAFAQVFRHTYDEVFQASQEAVERHGWFITDANKDRGVISGTVLAREHTKYTFELRIEAVSDKPETRVTITFGAGGMKRDRADGFFIELQQVLATYK
jgi:hypothetical protein